MTNLRGRHIIELESLKSARDLEWIAKVLANGFLHGKHDSNRLGSGMEFQQYRPYVIGDDIRNIDWKMFAKTDKYYVKQTSIPTEHKSNIIIDDSLSMNYKEGNWSKLMLAKIITAAISRVFSNQGDLFSWQSSSASIQLSSGMRHWHNSVNELFALEAKNGGKALDAHLIKNSTTLWISDLYYNLGDIEKFLKKLRSTKNEVIIFHILGEAEKTLEFSRSSTFVDLESGERLDVNAPKIRQNYQQKLSAHIQEVKNLCFNYGIFYEEISLNKPVSESLKRFFFHYQMQMV